MLCLVGGLAYWFTKKDTGNTMGENPLSNFEITDTASIQKIFIADLEGNNVTISRSEEGYWKVNNKYRVREHSFDLILETFAGVGIQSTVPKAMRNTVLRNMAVTQRKVMIYGENDKLIKTWYLGNPTKTNQGTYMILETPEEGLSTEPYIVEKRGFRGYLTNRFHTKVNEWRYKGVFIYPKMDIKKITVIRPKMPEKGFELKVNNLLKNELEMTNHEGDKVDVNPTAMQLYLLKFKELHLETFDPPLLNHFQEDSVAARIPDFRITVTNTTGVTTKIDLQYKPTLANVRLEDPTAPEVDPDRMFGVFNGETIQVQRASFDPVLMPLEYFLE